MPEPLSLLATASTLTITAARVVKLLYELYSALQDAPLILSSVIAECAGVRASLAILQSAQHDLAKDNPKNAQVVETIDDMLMSCALTLSVLEREIQTYLVVGKGPHDEHAIKHCKMIISEDYLSKLLDQLRAQSTGLTMLMTALNSKSLQRLKEYAEDNRATLKAIARRASLIWRESDSWSKRISASFVASKGDTQESCSADSPTQFEFDRDITSSIPYQKQMTYARMLEERQGADNEVSEWPNFANWRSPALSGTEEAKTERVPATVNVSASNDELLVDVATEPAPSVRATSDNVPWQYFDDILPALQMSLETQLGSPFDEKAQEGALSCSPAYTTEYEHALVVVPRETDSLKEIAESLSSTRRKESPENRSILARSIADVQPFIFEPSYDTIDGAPPPRAKIKVSIRQSADRQRFLNSLKSDPCTLGHIEKAFANVWSRVSIKYASSLATRKIVLIGGYVGKTTLVHRLFRCHDEHLDDIGTEYHARIALDSAQFKLVMCKDISLGGYSTTRTSLWRNCHVAVVCYSISQRSSLLEINEWVAQVRDAEPNCSIILLGCQSDARYDEKTLQYAVRYEEGLDAARKINAMVYLECSAKTSAGMNDLFEMLTKCCVLCDTHNTWKSSAFEVKNDHKAHSSTMNVSRISTSLKKTNRFKNGIFAASWLTDKLTT